ncbi:MAG TPA: UDP-N-acetylmuramoyl-tripeptide--D-alanyl-D-alanine ligase [Thermoanaerobaculia bacterium]|nr:UDP-N-acetylmuramoyl-tripeptide--D-alanyl-D-alanine ligase [Thermoanaerobaculia bacterium]
MTGSLRDAAAAMDGRLVTVEPDALFSGAAIDSRKVAAGELFFALRGTRADGHRFVADALGRGAAAAVVARARRRELGRRAPRIEVADPFAALHALTRHVRARALEHLVGVTGSAGKTTTKDLLAGMLARRFRTAASPGNLNNLYGFPLALLGIPDATQWMVAEMGMSEPGELALLSELARPDAVVLTNVRPVHLEFFGTLERIAEAKAEVFAGLEAGGTVVANADDPQVVRIAMRRLAAAGGEAVWYSLAGASPAGAELTLRVRDLECPARGLPESRFALESIAGGESVRVRLPLVGRHNVENCLAAATAAFRFGVPLAAIAEAAAAATPSAMRGVLRDSGEAQVYDDAYNSNPDAVARALVAVAELPAQRRWAVLGDMLELGPEAKVFHREAGRQAARLGFAPVVGVGELAREIAAGAAEQGGTTAWFATAAEAAEFARAEIAPGDLLLVKGSRGVGLEVVVERVLGRS